MALLLDSGLNEKSAIPFSAEVRKSEVSAIRDRPQNLLFRRRLRSIPVSRVGVRLRRVRRENQSLTFLKLAPFGTVPKICSERLKCGASRGVVCVESNKEASCGETHSHTQALTYMAR